MALEINAARSMLQQIAQETMGHGDIGKDVVRGGEGRIGLSENGTVFKFNTHWTERKFSITSQGMRDSCNRLRDTLYEIADSLLDGNEKALKEIRKLLGTRGENGFASKKLLDRKVVAQVLNKIKDGTGGTENAWESVNGVTSRSDTSFKAIQRDFKAVDDHVVDDDAVEGFGAEDFDAEDFDAEDFDAEDFGKKVSLSAEDDIKSGPQTVSRKFTPIQVDKLAKESAKNTTDNSVDGHELLHIDDINQLRNYARALDRSAVVQRLDVGHLDSAICKLAGDVGHSQKRVVNNDIEGGDSGYFSYNPGTVGRAGRAIARSTTFFKVVVPIFIGLKNTGMALGFGAKWLWNRIMGNKLPEKPDWEKLPTPVYLDPSHDINTNNNARSNLITHVIKRLDELGYKSFNEISPDLRKALKLKDFGLVMDNADRKQNVFGVEFVSGKINTDPFVLCTSGKPLTAGRILDILDALEKEPPAWEKK